LDGKASLALVTIEQNTSEDDAQKKQLTDGSEIFQWSFRAAAFLEVMGLRKNSEHFFETWTLPTLLAPPLVCLILLALIVPKKVIKQESTTWSFGILMSLIIIKIFTVYTLIESVDSINVVTSNWQYLVAQILWVFSILCIGGIYHELKLKKTGIK